MKTILSNLGVRVIITGRLEELAGNDNNKEWAEMDEKTLSNIQLCVSDSTLQEILTETRFRRFRGCRVQFSCFASQHSLIPLKTSSGAQNMKTGADAHSTAENESGSAKHENRSLRPLHRQK
jgi:hypothetical protein